MISISAALYSCEFDSIMDNYNLGTMVCLLNYLASKVVRFSHYTHHSCIRRCTVSTCFGEMRGKRSLIVFLDKACWEVGTSCTVHCVGVTYIAQQRKKDHTKILQSTGIYVYACGMHVMCMWMHAICMWHAYVCICAFGHICHTYMQNHWCT